MSNNKLIAEFGSTPITTELIKRFERVTGQAVHTFIRRGLFFSHRDLELILDDHAAGKPIYLYTGRGPSAGSFHLGHLVPFLFTAYLQRVFNAHVVIQITDDEKFTHRDCTMEEIEHNTKENIKDIIACGFDPDKTFIFTNFGYIGKMYKNVVQIQAKLTNSQVFSTFGIEMNDNIGRTGFCAIQAAPCLPSSFPHLFKERRRCLVPCGIDQDPYFRLTRDISPRLGYLIKKKIGGAFSGGCELKEEQLQKGADLSVDIAFWLLTYFLDDDAELEEIRAGYGCDSDVRPKMLSGTVKKRAIQVVTAIIDEHQTKRATITTDVVREFMKH
jgi:tryptophanyl-tRNA synthetase